MLRARIKRLLGTPARRLLDPRVEWTVSEIDDRLGSGKHTRLPVHDRFDELERRLDGLDRLGRQNLQALGHEAVPHGSVQVELARLDPASAAFLNWTDSPYGYAAQAGLWFNPPVPVEYHPGEVGVLLVNERIVEQPYVFASVAEACSGGPVRILDVGGSESTVALSLASLGHDVTVVDPRPCPLRHPRLAYVEARLEDLPADLPPFDVAISLSAIEHFGLEHYGTARGEDRADLQAIGQLRERLRPGGMLILTVPIGEPSVDAFQRVYDLAGVRELVGGFDLENLAVMRQVDRLTWEPASPDEDDHRRGVALLRARRP